ncbi:PREDICTED: L-type lectin-domain containing receptor kinase V.9-like [Nelumbo nucifera]|nr:PREDICTED: L-type lectin-domain containing receptor kinase V.9-like [Nelumbo nucifera]
MFSGDNLSVDGTAEIESDGLFKLTNATGRQTTGHVFYSLPLRFKKPNGSVLSFSTSFIFAILPDDQYHISGHGLAFVISPSKDLPGVLPSQYLGLFNNSNIGDPSNHIVAVEVDTILSREFSDINDNHVGIDINSLISIESAKAGYHADDNGGGFMNLSLISGDPLQIWVEYDGAEKQLNVTLYPPNIPRPHRPLLSLRQDLSPFILDDMYVGFSSSTGSIRATHYILAWSFKMNGQAKDFDLSRLPKFPQGRQQENPTKKKKKPKVLAISLSSASLVLLLATISVIALITVKWKRRYMEVLEDWEVQYGPHRFTYKDLFIATKGFKERKLLGRGGFGGVYRGVLPTSKIHVAVKRVSHDSRQGMREFVAEIATIGRLRHPNLVRLLGYCRRKGELLLVYDYMPKGSLNKFLFDQPRLTLSWAQRFKIIRDVASGLLYLHHQWVQVIIHRDIKASNVLIDGEMNGRLGDFGLAKWCDHGTDPQTTNLAGTLGYIAPELARTGKATTRSDLFAFGSFLLEVACGRRPVEPRVELEKIILVDWVTDCWGREDILQTLDPKLGMEYVVEEAELVLKLGLLCSHPVAAARPSMLSVVRYLNGDAPLPEDFNANVLVQGRNENSNEIATSNPSSEKGSRRSLTITEQFISVGR